MSSILDDNYREFDFEDSGESESNQSDKIGPTKFKHIYILFHLIIYS